MMSDLTFRITLPTDEGFVGRTCAHEDCRRYFRVHADSVPEVVNCPYCGRDVEHDDLHTSEQLEYAKRVAQEKALEHMTTEINKAFGRALRGSKFLKYKPGRPYRARPVSPNYKERTVDSELRCPNCSTVFQIDGLFAYCIACKLENIAIYDANLAAIRSEVAKAPDQQRALRHAYNDLVATFEAICARRARHLGLTGSFQDPFEARRFFRKHALVDLCASLSANQELTVRRVFHKRHAYQHAQGKITERYVQKLPEDRGLLGQRAELTVEEFDAGARVVRLMVDELLRVVPQGE